MLLFKENLSINNENPTQNKKPPNKKKAPIDIQFTKNDPKIKNVNILYLKKKKTKENNLFKCKKKIYICLLY
jgi:hypothetical protein